MSWFYEWNELLFTSSPGSLFLRFYWVFFSPSSSISSVFLSPQLAYFHFEPEHITFQGFVKGKNVWKNHGELHTRASTTERIHSTWSRIVHSKERKKQHQIMYSILFFISFRSNILEKLNNATWKRSKGQKKKSRKKLVENDGDDINNKSKIRKR